MYIVPFPFQIYKGKYMSKQNLPKKRTLRSVKKDGQSKKKNLRFDTKELRKKRKKIVRNIRESLCWILEILLVCIVAYLLVCGFGQRVSNAGDSMKPVLKNGDVVLVNRVKYALVQPKRGDIIAFKPGGNASSHYSVKRIVALPGETIQIKEGEIYINGNNTQEHIYAQNINSAGVALEPLKMGKDEYFVLGDNSTSSDDSRKADIGNVEKKDIYGKVWFIASPGSRIGFVKNQ